MQTKNLTLDEILELIVLENLPDAPEDDIYNMYLHAKLEAILTFELK